MFDVLKLKMIKAKLNASGGGRVFLTAMEAFLLGAFAKCVATIVTYPLVKLKTTLQTGSGQVSIDEEVRIRAEVPIHRMVEYGRQRA